MPLLLIGEVINKLKDIKYFNKLDLMQRYNNVQINKWKVAFLTNKRLFKSKVVYFGLYNLKQEKEKRKRKEKKNLGDTILE